MKKDKNKSNICEKLGTTLLCIVMFITSFFVGILIVKNPSPDSNLSTKISSLSLGTNLLILYFALYLQIIIHEGGHLIFGLLSGYKFLYFKIGNFMWIKIDGKLKLKYVKIVGMGGQCIMTPPDLVDGKMPYFLYNLGGSIANLIITLICLALYIPFKDTRFLSEFLFVSLSSGIVFALCNGIPFKTSLIANDGYNALHLGKDKEALYSLWAQLKLVSYQAQNVRLKNLPAGLLYMPDSISAKENIMISSLGVFYANMLMDGHEFDKTVAIIDKLIDENYQIAPLHKKLLICDKIYCYILSNKPIDNLYDKEQKQFMKQMRKFPSVLRTQYAIELLNSKDTKRADIILNTFDKISVRYPFSSDIESERELINLARKHSDSQLSSITDTQP